MSNIFTYMYAINHLNVTNETLKNTQMQAFCRNGGDLVNIGSFELIEILWANNISEAL